MLTKRLIYVTGLPRAGSTLLCQLLGIHPDIYSLGYSSPLCQILNQLRHHLSDNEFLLSQLDVDFELGYQRLLNTFRGVLNGWFMETDKPWVVDKNRGWLLNVETVKLLDPELRMLVCIRELGQIWGSIEVQHQKTLLLDFPDHLANLSPYARADKLFAADGVVGAPLKTLESVQDLPETLQQRLFFVVFEDFMQRPAALLAEIYQWLGLPVVGLDLNHLPVKSHESDSYYHFKYRHQVFPSLQPPPRHVIPARIEAEIRKNFGWFYQTFYPALSQSS